MKLDQNDVLAIFEMDRSDFRRLKMDQIEFGIKSRDNPEVDQNSHAWCVVTNLMIVRYYQ